MWVLRAIAGPIKGAVFRLARQEVVVGRLSSSHLCIGDPSVSRQHCTILPTANGFCIRDLGSNNGTFVNAQRVHEAALADGDKVRIGDTILAFADDALSLPDNGVVANSYIQTPVSECAETAMRRLFDHASLDRNFVARAGALLEMGARLNIAAETGALEAEILRQALEITPADRVAIVLLNGETADPSIIGRTRGSAGSTAVPVSRTLVARAIADGKAIFTEDVATSDIFAEVSSLNARRVESVIVVPLMADGKAIGTLYLESSDSAVRMNPEHLGLTAVLAEYAGPGLERLRRLSQLRYDNQSLRGALESRHILIGRAAPMVEILARIARVASTDATVLIRGETGTGKELAARAIHKGSLRAARPFEAINCSLLVGDSLLLSELFGHEKGSFTGAIAQKKGRLELAEGGTLFLDELAALGEAPQAMLLRVLQERVFQRLGGSRTLNADIRIIAATNENLEEAVRNKKFRQDLYYRLNVAALTMPPLRERREDILLLADHFVQYYSRKNKRAVTGVSPQAEKLLLRYDWPGNVRELENAIEHAIVFGSTSDILPEDLPDVLLEFRSPGETPFAGYHEAVRKARCDIVLSALKSTSGDYSEAAKRLGIHVNNLHRLIRELRLKPLVDAHCQH